MWTHEQDEALKAAANLGRSYGEAAKKLGVSRCSVAGRAHRLGLKFSGRLRYPEWSSAEDKALRKLYGKVRMKEVMRALPGRKRDAIYQRASQFGLTDRRR